MKKTQFKCIQGAIFALIVAMVSSGSEALAAESPAKVFSRSIMPHCQFVYSVESDIRVVSNSADPEGKVLFLAWDDAWTDEVEFQNPLYLEPHLESEIEFDQDSKPGDPVTWQVTIQSMSTSEDFLRRTMFLQWGEWDESGDFVPLSEIFWSDIGRQFGEACQTSRNSDAVYHQRQLNLL